MRHQSFEINLSFALNLSMAKTGTVKSSLKYFKLDFKKQAHPFVRFSLSTKNNCRESKIQS